MSQEKEAFDNCVIPHDTSASLQIPRHECLDRAFVITVLDTKACKAGSPLPRAQIYKQRIRLSQSRHDSGASAGRKWRLRMQKDFGICSLRWRPKQVLGPQPHQILD